MNIQRIGVLGIGKLGLSFALLAEHCGYSVLGQDVRSDYVEVLNRKEYTTSEPLIEQYLQESKAFMATTDLEAVVLYANILFCFVATPSLPDGSYDHSAIDRIVSDLQELHVKGLQMDDRILVIGCTTMPGYCDKIARRLQTAGIQVVYNPEFIAQGSIIQGLQTADMVLIGTESDIAVKTLRGLYASIMTIPLNDRIMSRTAAEITKISINCFLTMKIAYANMIGEIAINSDIENEVGTILGAIGTDSRIGSKYLGYGFGFGGVCLPRDMNALGLHMRNNGQDSYICHDINRLNIDHHAFLCQYFTEKNPDKNIPFLFTQLTYKKGVDILTESWQYRLCQWLLTDGYSVDITESSIVIAQVQKELAEYGDKVTYGTITDGYTISI